jgi:chromatin remodeling complex protein RSC6
MGFSCELRILNFEFFSTFGIAKTAYMPLEAPMAKTSETPKRKANPALLKPVQPDAMLAVVVGSTPIPRSEVTKKLWDYIKKNKLQDQTKKTNINADAALTAVFGGKKQVTMFEMTKLVSQHIK